MPTFVARSNAAFQGVQDLVTDLGRLRPTDHRMDLLDIGTGRGAEGASKAPYK